jgi:hypothetical protein
VLALGVKALVSAGPASRVVAETIRKGRSEGIRSFPGDYSREPVAALGVQFWLFGTVTVTVLVMRLAVLSVQVIVMV